MSYIFLETHDTRECKRCVFQNARVLPSKLMRHPTFERKVMGRRCSNLGFKAKAIRPMPFRSGSLSSKLASWLARAAMVCPAPFGLKVQISGNLRIKRRSPKSGTLDLRCPSHNALLCKGTKIKYSLPQIIGLWVCPVPYGLKA